MEDQTQHRLATEMDIALMRAHLRLDISQMMDKQIREAFQRVSSHIKMSLILGPKHPGDYTDRPAHSTALFLPTAHFHHCRISDVSFHDSSKSMDGDHAICHHAFCTHRIGKSLL